MASAAKPTTYSAILESNLIQNIYSIIDKINKEDSITKLTLTIRCVAIKSIALTSASVLVASPRSEPEDKNILTCFKLVDSASFHKGDFKIDHWLMSCIGLLKISTGKLVVKDDNSASLKVIVEIKRSLSGSISSDTHNIEFPSVEGNPRSTEWGQKLGYLSR